MLDKDVLDKELYDALNAVALKKMSTAPALADALGWDPPRAERALRELAERDLVAIVGDAALPTDRAMSALETAAAEHYGELRNDPAVLAVADRFEDVNTRFLAAMSAWQLVDVAGRKVPNDHGDAEYDAKVVTRIERLVARLTDLLGTLAHQDPRFAGYTRRLERALGNVDAGDIEYISSPTVDSVHNVWFEFHEDLLRTLGRARKE